MKALRSPLIVLLMAGMLLACNHVAKNYNSAKADSVNVVQNDTTNEGDTSEDVASTDTSSTLNMVVDNEDSQFAVDAINSGLTEVKLGKLAIQKGKSKKIKNFGTMMVKDHDKINDKLMAIIKAKKITLPTPPDPAQQKIIEDLSQKTGDDFDKAYIKMMIADHQDDVKFFMDQSKKIQDPDLKSFATKTLPVQQKHLDAINAINDSMRN